MSGLRSSQDFRCRERGGIYQIQCKRWSEGANQFDLQNTEVAMQWVMKPGPLGVEGEQFIPPTFAIDAEDWRDQTQLAIPAFVPIKGKASPSYRYNADQTWEEVLSRGASHTANEIGPGGYQNTLQTVGDPLDSLGEQGFAALTKAELTQYATQIPPLAFYITDWEKQPGWHNTPTYWSIDLADEKILRNYFFYFSELNRLQPARKNGTITGLSNGTTRFMTKAKPIHCDRSLLSRRRTLKRAPDRPFENSPTSTARRARCAMSAGCTQLIGT